MMNDLQVLMELLTSSSSNDEDKLIMRLVQREKKAERELN